jgi:hypothetical protein
VLIGALPLYSNAKDPDFDLVEQPQGFFQSPEFILTRLITQALPSVVMNTTPALQSVVLATSMGMAG